MAAAWGQGGDPFSFCFFPAAVVERAGLNKDLFWSATGTLSSSLLSQTFGLLVLLLSARFKKRMQLLPHVRPSCLSFSFSVSVLIFSYMEPEQLKTQVEAPREQEIFSV